MWNTSAVSIVFMVVVIVRNDPAPRPPAGDPVQGLPKQVIAPEGKVSLFADFEDSEKDHVPVYFVNRTNKSIILKAQDGDVYLKLEYESAPGVWTRAQSHVYSWCGNSYFHPPEILPGRYLLIKGFRVEKGEMQAVRYRFYQQGIELSSNITRGLVNDEEVERAAMDDMTIQMGSLEFLQKVALGENKKLSGQRLYAIQTLAYGKHDPKIVDSILRKLSIDSDQNIAERAIKILAERRLSRP